MNINLQHAGVSDFTVKKYVYKNISERYGNNAFEKFGK